MPRYDAHRIESKWQADWDANETFRTPQGVGNGPKLYALDMFPYPSGSGLHVGHPEGYTATDIVSRYRRMCGVNVMHPMGWDAFGLPAEQYAIETGTHPRVTTYKNIDTFRRQLKMLGFSYDWSREIATTDPEYFRWTQWIFLQLFDTWYDPDCVWNGPDGRQRTGKGRPIAELPIPEEVRAQGADAVRSYQDERRLAYQSEAPVNWCPALGTVLANEEVTAEGKSERGNHPVERRALRQWMLRITAYAERLIGELDDVDWPESVKLLQRNWIGKSVGAEVDFFIGGDSVARFSKSGSPNAPSAGATDVSPVPSSASFDAWKQSRSASGFPKAPGDDVLRVYTTRPDTLFGATYMVIAPEHPLVARLTTAEHRAAVEEYCRRASLKSDLDRTDLAKEKTGVFTGSHAINPVNGAPVPIWIADYVLISYGTGAIMAVPAHDERDLEFAQTFGLPVVEVVQSPDPQTSNIGFTGDGIAIHSGEFDGLSTPEFKQRITARLDTDGLGRRAINFRLRDWLFSRQRYWGEPFPIWHELDAAGNLTGRVRPVDAAELPVTLPDMDDFKPRGTPEPPLSFAPDSWLYRTAEDGTKLKRETNSMPQWAGSCWYYLRFCDPRNSERFIDPEIEKYWLPVDLYIGGAEHAVLHLLYSRFWHKVLFDLGHLTHPEPFRKLVNQGMILGEAELTGFRDAQGNWVSAREANPEKCTAVKVDLSDVVKQGEWLVLKDHPEIVIESRAQKMSKSRGNVINPDEIVDKYGADSLRLYEMFMGPLEQVKPWSMSGVEGVFRFLGRVWRMLADDRAEDVRLNEAVQDVPPTEAQLRTLHKTIKAVTDDIEKLSLNTAISRMMEFTNEIGGQDVRPKSILEPFVLLLSPFAPHLAEELWQMLGHDRTLAYEPWPQYDPAKLVESEVEIPVQVNGKVRGRVKVPAHADQQTTIELATAAVAAQLEGKQLVKTIALPAKMVNFVVKG